MPRVVTFTLVKADWCGACRNHLPVFNKLLNAYNFKNTVGKQRDDMQIFFTPSISAPDAQGSISVRAYPTYAILTSDAEEPVDPQQYHTKDKIQTRAKEATRAAANLENEARTLLTQLNHKVDSLSDKDIQELVSRLQDIATNAAQAYQRVGINGYTF